MSNFISGLLWSYLILWAITYAIIVWFGKEEFYQTVQEVLIEYSVFAGVIVILLLPIIMPALLLLAVIWAIRRKPWKDED